MIIRTIEIDTEEHAKEFDAIINQLDYVKTSNQFYKITEQDATMGMGRKATDEELFAYFSEDKKDQHLITSDKVFSPYK